MLILPEAGIVILENPKTGTMSLRGMLGEAAIAEGPRHASVTVYAAEADGIARRFGQRFETLAVVREPLDRLRSWHRYRQREAAAGHAESSVGVTFDAFLRAALSRHPPAYARIGRQDRFVGWDGRMARVDRLYDFARLDLLVEFLSARLGQTLVLPHRNASPPGTAASLSPEALALFGTVRAAEIGLYRAAAAAGVLVRA